jgi:hypothetical protein
MVCPDGFHADTIILNGPGGQFAVYACLSDTIP